MTLGEMGAESGCSCGITVRGVGSVGHRTSTWTGHLKGDRSPHQSQGKEAQVRPLSLGLEACDAP